ncbi:hypothetical protein, partial [Acinetobacter sp.]|uniref:hypothetical protein n=1 Tax=Acinetobacter sp. TaxID=472 RepID=UPI0037532033
MKVDIKNICLNKIVVDPTFTSEVARSNRATKSDHQLVLDYIRLQEDLRFIDLIRVFEENGSYFLASNFACYEAHKRIFSEDPLKEIACLIFSDTT